MVYIKTQISLMSLFYGQSIIMVELRKVQALQGERTLTVVLPKEFASLLEIRKGDFLKVAVDGKKLVLEKADLE
jgi:Antidote-toxin recognition MazE, bacterial antitoxin